MCLTPSAKYLAMISYGDGKACESMIIRARKGDAFGCFSA